MINKTGGVKRENILFELDKKECNAFVKRIAGEKYAKKINVVKNKTKEF